MHGRTDGLTDGTTDARTNWMTDGHRQNNMLPSSVGNKIPYQRSEVWVDKNAVTLKVNICNGLAECTLQCLTAMGLALLKEVFI